MMKTRDMLMWTVRKTIRPQPLTKNCKLLQNAELKKQPSPGVSHTNWLSNTKFSALGTFIRVTLYKLSRLYLRIYMYILYAYIQM